MRYRTLAGGQGPQVSNLCLGILPFGSTVDEQTSFAVLDRFAEAGGTFVDTANNYSVWAPGGTGDESELLLGRRLRSRGARERTVVATKTLMAYGPLAHGAYTRADKPLPAPYDHPMSQRRLAVLREVAREAGVTPNQVVLAWQMGGPLPIVPVVGVSSVAQLDEVLGAVDLDLDPALRAGLDAA